MIMTWTLISVSYHTDHKIQTRSSANAKTARYAFCISGTAWTHRWYHLIHQMQFPISALYWCNTWLAPFLRLMVPQCKVHTPLVFLGRIQDNTIQVIFSTRVAKTLNQSFVMCPFPLFVAICDNNPLVLQTDRRHASNINVRCYAGSMSS